MPSSKESIKEASKETESVFSQPKNFMVITIPTTITEA
jgi:hypothetical protein